MGWRGGWRGRRRTRGGVGTISCGTAVAGRQCVLGRARPARRHIVCSCHNAATVGRSRGALCPHAHGRPLARRARPGLRDRDSVLRTPSAPPRASSKLTRKRRSGALHDHVSSPGARGLEAFLLIQSPDGQVRKTEPAYPSGRAGARLNRGCLRVEGEALRAAGARAAQEALARDSAVTGCPTQLPRRQPGPTQGGKDERCVS